MDDILQQLKARATNSDTTTRLNLLSFVKELQQLLETPADTLQRIAYSVRENIFPLLRGPQFHGSS